MFPSKLFNMKKIFSLIVVAFLSSIIWAQQPQLVKSVKSTIEKSPEEVAQLQLNAYNAHDLEAFLEVYSEDVEIYSFPNTLKTKGKAAMRKEYDFITKTPKLFCKLLNRIVQGNMVIDHEEVYGFGDKPFYGIAIYIVEKGKITKVYFPK
jgi:hypothetical protein